MTVSVAPTDGATRVATLRERCLDRKAHAWRDVRIPTMKSLRATEHSTSWQVRQGVCARDRLSAIEFVVDDCELLLGRLAPRPASAKDVALDHDLKVLWHSSPPCRYVLPV